jgi:hypothetical protein
MKKQSPTVLFLSQKQSCREAELSAFSLRGRQGVREVSPAEMLGHTAGLHKLLANMLAVCKPGALSEEELACLSHLNGRGVLN